ncbi:MAG: hypothetical protein ACYTDU_03200 [Planctomycetota bacterium]
MSYAISDRVSVRAGYRYGKVEGFHGILGAELKLDGPCLQAVLVT